MTSNLSVADILARIEAQIAFHQERQAFHAEQEAAHRDQRDRHTAELEKISRHYEDFKANAEVMEALAVSPVAVSAGVQPGSAPDGLDPHLRYRKTELIAAVIAGKGAQEVFGTAGLTAEVNQRFRERLREKVEERGVSVVLRRLLRDRRIHLVRSGRPHQEALYSREQQKPRT